MTDITVRATPPGPDIATISARRLAAAAALHYHIARHLDAQVAEEMRLISAARRIGLNRLRRHLRRRAEAEEIYLLYLQEICRRVRVAQNLNDSQTDDELLHQYLRDNACRTVETLKEKTQKIEAAATGRFWNEYFQQAPVGE